MFGWLKKRKPQTSQERLLWITQQTRQNMAAFVGAACAPFAQIGDTRFSPANIKPDELTFLSLALVSITFVRFASSTILEERKYELNARLRKKMLSEVIGGESTTEYASRHAEYREILGELFDESVVRDHGAFLLTTVLAFLFRGNNDAESRAPFFLQAERLFDPFRENLAALITLTSQLRDDQIR